jgi:hypothetical protein
MTDAKTAKTTGKSKRRWCQFSLRTLLLFVTFCALPCSWFAVNMQQVKKQRKLIKTIQKMGGSVRYEYELPGIGSYKPPGPDWLRKLLGDDFFANVGDVSLWGRRVKDADLELLSGFPHLQMLSIQTRGVTDAGLERLKGLSRLRTLSLDRTNITGTGLDHLKGLTHLESLSLDETPATDAGLEHIKVLTQLQYLSLNRTHVTDDGVERLKRALPHCKIRHGTH